MNKADSEYCLFWAKKIRAINILGGKCYKCNNSNIFVLEFHHPNKNKDNKIFYHLKFRRWSVVEKEIRKCNLLCRNCHSSIHSFGTKRNIKIKRKLLEIKGTNKCEQCGYIPDNVGVLSFHHVRDKKFEVNACRVRFSDISWEDVILEIDKCIVLCLNCHATENIKIEKFNRLKQEIDFRVKHPREISFPIDPKVVYDMYFNQDMKQSNIAKYFKCAKSTICGIVKSFDRKKEKVIVSGKTIICLECKREFISKRDSKFCSRKCCFLFHSKDSKPTKEQLVMDLATLNWSQLGNKYGTSHTTAIRWAKNYGVYSKSSENGQKVME